MLLGDDEDEIEIVQLNEEEKEERSVVENQCEYVSAFLRSPLSDLFLAAYPPMPDWMASGKPSSKSVELGLDLEARALPVRKIALGRVMPPAAPAMMNETASDSAHASRPRVHQNSSEAKSNGADEVDDEDDEVVDLEEMESSPPRPPTRQMQDARKASPRRRPRPGLIDTQSRMDESLPMDTVSLPARPPRSIIPSRMSMSRSTSMNNTFPAPVPSLNAYRTVEQEEIEDLGEREETPAPRAHRPHIFPRREDSGSMSRQTSYNAAMNDDGEIVPVELEPIPMPASPPPEAIPIPGIDRTYSMAQPMANLEPPSKNYKQTTSIVAKARAVVKAHKGLDASVAKRNKGRDADKDKDDGQNLKKQLSELDNEVNAFPPFSLFVR